MATLHNPLAQFMIKKFIDLQLFGIDISVTNAALFMCGGCVLILCYLGYALNSDHIVPSRLQLSGELIHQFISDMIAKNIGDKGKVFLPFIFSLFLFILILNILGLMPFGFTVTSHIAITFTLALFVFFTVLITGFILHGVKFLGLFLPHGTPYWLAPLMIMIELFAFLARPISLSLRLAANMVAGHVLLKVIAGFVISLGILFKFLPMAFIVVLMGFEFFVALLQAYIFAILACVYINDAVNLH